MAVLLGLTACNNQPVQKSSMHVFVDGVGEITADTTLIVDEVYQSISGYPEMALNGRVDSVSTLDVNIHRRVLDAFDEFCCAGTCSAGDGEAEQSLHFKLPEGTTSSPWYIHCRAEQDTVYAITYHFINQGKKIQLQVVFDNQTL